MRTTLRALLALPFFTALTANARYDLSSVEFWVGTGADSSVLVIDFLDGSPNGSSFAWGYLHDGTATAEDMLLAIDAADINLQIDMAGSFINSITYNTHAGIGGAPNWWGTWSGTGISDLAMNGGASEPLSNGAWFGCSYTDFDPAIAPGEPQAALDPLRFTAADVTYWVGAGQDSSVLVIDFLDGSPEGSSFAWGYLHDGTATAEDMLLAIDAADINLQIDMAGSFINSITYNAHAGIGGAPNWWGTWSGTRTSDLAMNGGASEPLSNGAWFGCSYTDFNPALRPGRPVAATFATGIADRPATATLSVFSQPATDRITIRSEAPAGTPLRITDLTGKLVYAGRTEGSLSTVPVSTFATGLYLLQVGDVKRTIAVD
ncbi:MAG: T9SS type A sorting domain-containing protein [Flavobacteriales bacterium]